MKPVVILDPHFRKMEELFRPSTYAALAELCDLRGGMNAPMPRSEISAHLPEAQFYISSRPTLDEAEVATAQNLKATIEVAGAFRDGLAYSACFDRGIEVLSCSPGFRESVAEMTLAMMLAGGRGLVAEHEAFRKGDERWLDDRDGIDFSLYDDTVGFIGYGQISREVHRLIEPFRIDAYAYDPFLSDAGPNTKLVELEELVATCRVIVVAAVPSEETQGLLSAELIAKLRPGALVIVISRAWSTDFPALVKAAEARRITLATDVFPDEPVDPADPVRALPNAILSPHRAAAVPGGRHLIGDMLLHDIQAIMEGRPERHLKSANPADVQSLVAAQSLIKGMAET